jgi:hypothetical protein
MDEMAHVLRLKTSRCRMSREALPNEEVAARVRVAVSGDFQA